MIDAQKLALAPLHGEKEVIGVSIVVRISNPCPENAQSLKSFPNFWQMHCAPCAPMTRRFEGSQGQGTVIRPVGQFWAPYDYGSNRQAQEMGEIAGDLFPGAKQVPLRTSAGFDVTPFAAGKFHFAGTIRRG
jgi:hypothetical protein